MRKTRNILTSLLAAAIVATATPIAIAETTAPVVYATMSSSIEQYTTKKTTVVTAELPRGLYGSHIEIIEVTTNLRGPAPIWEAPVKINIGGIEHEQTTTGRTLGTTTHWKIDNLHMQIPEHDQRFRFVIYHDKLGKTLQPGKSKAELKIHFTPAGNARQSVSAIKKDGTTATPQPQTQASPTGNTPNTTRNAKMMILAPLAIILTLAASVALYRARKEAL